MRRMATGLCMILLTCPPAMAKPLQIENDTDQTVVSVSVETETSGKSPKKPKKDIAVGLAMSPNHGKGRGKGGLKDEDDGKSKKPVEIDTVSEDDCLAKLTFTLSNGKSIRTPTVDLCNLDGIIVEDELDQQAVAPAALPPLQP